MKFVTNRYAYCDSHYSWHCNWLDRTFIRLLKRLVDFNSIFFLCLNFLPQAISFANYRQSADSRFFSNRFICFFSLSHSSSLSIAVERVIKIKNKQASSLWSDLKSNDGQYAALRLTKKTLIALFFLCLYLFLSKTLRYIGYIVIVYNEYRCFLHLIYGKNWEKSRIHWGGFYI